MNMCVEVPEFCWIVINGDGIGSLSLSNGESFGGEKKILNLTGIAIEADVLAAIAERSGLLLLSDRFVKEVEAHLFHFGNDVVRDTMVDHLEETIFFTGFYYQPCHL